MQVLHDGTARRSAYAPGYRPTERGHNQLLQTERIPVKRYLGCIAFGAVAGIAILAIADFIASQCFDSRLVPFLDKGL
jgi:hypothetical protein